jgi:hypothetical protein
VQKRADTVDDSGDQETTSEEAFGETPASCATRIIQTGGATCFPDMHLLYEKTLNLHYNELSCQQHI